MANEQTGRERDLVLAPNQYAFIQDETKGGITAYVGPNKTSLAATDRPVLFSADTRLFERCDLAQAIRVFPQANEGNYIVLENPAQSREQQHPQLGSSSAAVKLNSGRKVNLRGPLTFPLWPGQVASVIDGHRLRSNQFLMVRVYNEDEARQNWNQSVMKPAESDPQSGAGGQQPDGKPPAASADQGDGVSDPSKKSNPAVKATTDLTIGQLIVIKGSDVSFYIPPTGIDVVPDANGQFIRDAVTLERLEYCILLDESGEKTVVKGPSVVFPEPTQSFVEKSGERKFRAIELNPDMGIYLKVTADFAEGERQFKTGEELFITGREQQIYYPRPEHAIIKYGDRELHYGVTIPEGEARYVLNKETGSVELVRGPQVFLPDPRKQVMVRRVLEIKETELLYPGNDYALEYNRRLLEALRQSAGAPVMSALADSQVRSHMPVTRNLAAAAGEFQRGNGYTAPRTITLDTKYEGAVAVSVWAGYAIKINDKSGASRVVVGPKTELLEYDETLQTLELSTGKPKSTDRLQRTVYLRAHQNQVSDIVDVVTRDMVNARVKLSYRVNFEGSPEKWFRIENYVKYLCDHVRSMLRHVAKQTGIESFNDGYIPIIRDAILGQKPEGGARRSGLKFEENGLHVYDVEVLGIEIGDTEIAQMLANAQHTTVRTTLQVAEAERKLTAAKRLAGIATENAKLEKDKIELEMGIILAKIGSEAQAAQKRAEEAVKQLERDAASAASARAIDKAEADQAFENEKRQLDETIRKLTAESNALAERAKAISPDLIAALQAFGDKMIATQVSEAMAPMAILGGKTVAEVVRNMMGDTAVGKAIATGLIGRSNGHANVATQDDSAE